jgi:hypothetical protein
MARKADESGEKKKKEEEGVVPSLGVVSTSRLQA